jgi:hypothetical protein
VRGVILRSCFLDFQLGSVIEKLRTGRDFVIGNHFRGGIKPDALPPLHRYLGNQVLTAIGRLLFHKPWR